MSAIKNFIDRIATLDSRQAREVILPMSEAKQLRDEISKLLVDQLSTQPEQKIEVVMNGGKW